MELAAITKKQEELVSDASREAASAYAWGIRLAREDNVQRKNWANPDLQLLKMHYDAVFAVNKEAHDARKAKQSGRGARILLGLGTVLNSGLAVTAFCYGDSVLMMFHIAVASIAAMQYGRTTRALIPLEDELALLQRERKAAQKRISDHPTHDWFKAVIPFDSISMTIAEAENQMKACLENEGEADFRRRIDVFIDKRSDT
jgi:hypothetical protein